MCTFITYAGLSGRLMGGSSRESPHLMTNPGLLCPKSPMREAVHPGRRRLQEVVNDLGRIFTGGNRLQTTPGVPGAFPNTPKSLGPTSGWDSASWRRSFGPDGDRGESEYVGAFGLGRTFNVTADQKISRRHCVLTSLLLLRTNQIATTEHPINELSFGIGPASLHYLEDNELSLLNQRRK